VDAQRVTAAPEEQIAELELKLRELRRVNEQLGRELVAGASSRQPHAPVTAGRRVTKLMQERDAARAELEQAKQRLREGDAAVDHFQRENEQLRFEAARLRFGPVGFLRRTLARLARR
jgi:adenylosuccinate lyase